MKPNEGEVREARAATLPEMLPQDQYEALADGFIGINHAHEVLKTATGALSDEALEELISQTKTLKEAGLCDLTDGDVAALEEVRKARAVLDAKLTTAYTIKEKLREPRNAQRRLRGL